MAQARLWGYGASRSLYCASALENSNADKAPQWNRDNPKTERFVEAFNKLMARQP
jgi:hypothetical protein